MIICKHQFVVVKPIETFEANSSRAQRVGVRCVCLHCSEIRDVWEDGSIIKLNGNTDQKA